MFDDYNDDRRQVWLWDKQLDIMDAIQTHDRVTVKGCFESSKTFCAARAALAFLYTNPGSIVVTTAPGNRQVEHLLWKEIRAAVNRARIPLGGRMLNKAIECINGDPRWYAVGFATGDRDAAIRMRGFHSPKMLVVVDEASGISDEIYDAIEGLLSNDGCKLLLIGNPLIAEGRFYDSFTSALYKHITISAYDTPNVKAGKELIPGLVSLRWVEERKADWGESSAAFQSRVLAQFPVAGSENLIPLSWIELAEQRWEDPEYGIFTGCQKVLGVDPGERGNDPTTYSWRLGNRIVKFEELHNQELMSTVGRCKIEHEKGWSLVIDVLGIGAGVGSRLREQGIPFRAHRGSNRTNAKDATGYLKFKNVRSYVYWKVRESLDPDGDIRLALPPNAKLRKDLVTINYGLESDSTIAIESKEKLKQKLGRSPDFGDALSMTMEVRVISPACAGDEDLDKTATEKKSIRSSDRIYSQAKWRY